ncbi:hypothetical protein GNI_031410 [Gregarina niphandrodes]|uniref:Uncharacterized protein n=1 Tax=Gregarina niphandrodes TaxID=110365 RepID=A0A023BB72_GRENI|nr:hypothetical protein GNI_031410 [Gregarina niphandrodes]EZG78876.1 hypothetical protein GNI_031410 [Gregarina niphandrodes]|eukprot:XP_011129166.1 hypothetical protein GNI_031410 [Gregarina niphandrodes]
MLQQAETAPKTTALYHQKPRARDCYVTTKRPMCIYYKRLYYLLTEFKGNAREGHTDTVRIYASGRAIKNALMVLQDLYNSLGHLIVPVCLELSDRNDTLRVSSLSAGAIDSSSISYPLSFHVTSNFSHTPSPKVASPKVAEYDATPYQDSRLHNSDQPTTTGGVSCASIERRVKDRSVDTGLVTRFFSVSSAGGQNADLSIPARDALDNYSNALVTRRNAYMTARDHQLSVSSGTFTLHGGESFSLSRNESDSMSFEMSLVEKPLMISESDDIDSSESFHHNYQDRYGPDCSDQSDQDHRYDRDARDEGRRCDQDKDRGHNTAGYDRDRGRGYDQDRGRGYDQDRDRGYDQDRDRGYDQDRGRGYDQDRSYGQGRSERDGSDRDDSDDGLEQDGYHPGRYAYREGSCSSSSGGCGAVEEGSGSEPGSADAEQSPRRPGAYCTYLDSLIENNVLTSLPTTEATLAALVEVAHGSTPINGRCRRSSRAQMQSPLLRSPLLREWAAGGDSGAASVKEAPAARARRRLQQARKRHRVKRANRRGRAQRPLLVSARRRRSFESRLSPPSPRSADSDIDDRPWSEELDVYAAGQCIECPALTSSSSSDWCGTLRWRTKQHGSDPDGSDREVSDPGFSHREASDHRGVSHRGVIDQGPTEDCRIARTQRTKKSQRSPARSDLHTAEKIRRPAKKLWRKFFNVCSSSDSVRLRNGIIVKTLD